MSEPRVLVVDDEKSMRDLLAITLQKAGYEVTLAEGGAAAMEAIRRDPFDAIITDLRMPKVDGLQVLRCAKDLSPDTAVIMVTAMASTETAVEAMKLGAYDYITKPFNLEELAVHVEKALERRNLLVENRAYHRSLEQRVAEQTREIREHLSLERRRREELDHTLTLLEQSYHDTIDALIMALDYRDNETQGHTQRVSVYSVELADRLGVKGAELETLKRGAILHDIGKIGVSDTILRKPSKLTDAEWTEMRRHVQYGYEMLKDIAFLQDAAKIVLHHHERFDGLGYPNKASREDILFGARIFVVADTFDAMTSHRPYRRVSTYQEVCAELAGCAGRQFDPLVVDAFMRIPEITWTELRRAVELVTRQWKSAAGF